VVRHLFVYGTLRPGDVRWHFLEPFVVDGGVADSVAGRTIHGQTLSLLAASVDHALAVLDEVEDVVGGEYRRVAVRTGLGIEAWSYAYGSGLDLTPIPSGDWFVHRPPRRLSPPFA